MPRRLTSAFNLVELISAIAIMAVLAVMAVEVVPFVVKWAQNVSDQRTLTVLNDALTRYKCQGGNLSALTEAAPVGHVLAGMEKAITWCGMSHNVMQAGQTYPSRSLGALGNGANYQFTQFNTFNSGTTTAAVPISGGLSGVAYYGVTAATSNLRTCVGTTSGYYAVKDSSGVISIYPGPNTASYLIPWDPVPRATTSLYIWSCKSATDSTPFGNMLDLCVQSNSGFSNINRINVTQVPTLQYFEASAINTGYVNGDGTLNLSNLTSLSLIYSQYTWSVKNILLPPTTIYAIALEDNFNLYTLDMSKCTIINGGWVCIDGTAISSTAANLNAFYSTLPTMASGTATVILSSSDAGVSGSTPSIATAKGWVVSVQ